MATDQWWNDNTKGHPDLKKFKDGLPVYLNKLDRMFEGVAVDGSSFVAGESYPIYESDGSDEQQEEEEEDQLTPLSVGIKRASSTSTTTSSLSKRSKSPAVRAMDNNMREYNEISRYKVRVMQNIWQEQN